MCCGTLISKHFNAQEEFSVSTALVSILAIVVFVIALNFVMLTFRLRRDRYKRPSREALDEEKAAIVRDHEIKRRLEREEKEALEFVEKRNKTFELYEEVRRRAAAREQEALEGNTPETASPDSAGKDRIDAGSQKPEN